MEERVILLDRDDNVIGSATKVDSHHASKRLPLHRAFSVFVFDSQFRMLLQQRAKVKATFASYWTNTCCSHPLHNAEELSPGGSTLRGVQNAAVRKLSHELGIREGSVAPEELNYVTRIHYKAYSDEGEWGEHEIDYVFFIQKDLEYNPSPNEVDDVKFVTASELQAIFEQAELGKTKVTPWFKYIMDSSGFNWWEKFQAGQLQDCVDTEKIMRFGDV